MLSTLALLYRFLMGIALIAALSACSTNQLAPKPPCASSTIDCGPAKPINGQTVMLEHEGTAHQV